MTDRPDDPRVDRAILSPLSPLEFMRRFLDAYIAGRNAVERAYREQQRAA